MIKQKYKLPEYETQQLWEIGRYAIVLANNLIWLCGNLAVEITTRPIAKLEIFPITTKKVTVDRPELLPTWELEDDVVYYYVAYGENGYVFAELSEALNFMSMIVQVKQVGLV